MAKPDTLTPAQYRARYERILKLRGPEDAPVMTYEDIGAKFKPPISRERVRQIIEAGPPAAHGRPRAAHNIEKKRAALALWIERRNNRAERGQDTAYAESRIASLSVELASVDGG
jgi:hypothetical protein